MASPVFTKGKIAVARSLPLRVELGESVPQNNL